MGANRRKLLVILGAGSSIPLGMPSVGKVDALMKLWSSEQSASQSRQPKIDVFKVLWEASERYFAANHYGMKPNYERVLGGMTALASWLSPPPFGNPVIEAIGGLGPFSSLSWLRDLSDEFAGRKLVLGQQEFLLGILANHMRDLCRDGILHSHCFCDYKNFFRSLRDDFDIGVYNLNYDTVARSAPGCGARGRRRTWT